MYCFDGDPPEELLDDARRMLDSVRVRAVMAACRRGTNRGLGMMPAALSCVVRHFREDSAANGDVCGCDGGPGGASEVLGARLMRQSCMRLPPDENRDCHCTDADTGRPLPPEPGVTYI